MTPLVRTGGEGGSLDYDKILDIKFSTEDAEINSCKTKKKKKKRVSLTHYDVTKSELI